MDSSYQLNLGGMCYRGVPSMLQIQPRAQSPAMATVGDLLHASKVGEDAPRRTTRMHTHCRETVAQNTDRAGIFGDSIVNLNVKASRGRQRAERADPPTPGG